MASMVIDDKFYARVNQDGEERVIAIRYVDRDPYTERRVEAEEVARFIEETKAGKRRWRQESVAPPFDFWCRYSTEFGDNGWRLVVEGQPTGKNSATRQYIVDTRAQIVGQHGRLPERGAMLYPLFRLIAERTDDV